MPGLLDDLWALIFGHKKGVNYMDKDWWKSSTLWGGVVMMGAFVASFLGITITSQEGSDLVNSIVKAADAISVLVGLIMVIIGRIKAGKEIKTLRMQVRSLGGRP